MTRTIPRTLPCALAFALVSTMSAQGTPAYPGRLESIWGGETHEVSSLLVNGQRHVWTTGDGPRIRHAIDPTAGVVWQDQAVPSDVKQNLMDVNFTPVPASTPVGFACGLNGHVLRSTNYGSTWTHFDSGRVLNQDIQPEPAVLWRVRFPSPDFGFVCGLWTFKFWNAAQSQWLPVDVFDADGTTQIDAGSIEFYALQLVVDPNNPSNWVGVVAGQQWGDVGGHNGHGNVGAVFYGSSSVSGGTRWTKVFETQGSVQQGSLLYEDPWDVEFEPNPASLTTATGYLCAGKGHDAGAVFKTTTSGRVWDPVPDVEIGNVLYGVAVIDADHVVAVGYGGEVFSRSPTQNPLWVHQRGVFNKTIETHTGPLTGAHNDGTTTYVTGTFGYVHSSTDQFATLSTNLNSASSEGNFEHWRFSDIYFTSDNHGYAVSQKKTVIETFNGGTDWNLAASSPNGLTGPNAPSLNALAFVQGQGRGVAVGSGVNVDTVPATLTSTFAYFYDESGVPWTPSLLSNNSNPTILDLALTDVAWVSGSGNTARFFAIGTASSTSQSNVPVMLLSTNGGRNWTSVPLPPSIPATAHLRAVAFRLGFDGYVVGHDGLQGSQSFPLAFRVQVVGAGSNPTVTVSQIAVPSAALGRDLRDVSANGTLVLAVGNQEGVYVFDSSQSQFTLDTTIPEAPNQTTERTFESVTVPPGSAAVALVGMATTSAEADTPTFGQALFFSGSAWEIWRAGTNKTLTKLTLRRPDFGFGVAGGEDGEGEFGMLGDCAVLKVHPGLVGQ